MQDHARSNQYPRHPGGDDEDDEITPQPALAQVPDRGADAERDRRDLVRGERDAERQAEEDQHRQLQQASAAAGERGKQVGQHRGGKKYELFEHLAANYWRDLTIMAGLTPAADAILW